jgi:hydrogenase nickel incorporation protein HypA/HybF
VHELSVALSLLEGVVERAESEGIERVTGVNVRVGAFSGIARDALLFSWDLATADTIAAGSALRIEDVALVVFCERCRAQSEPLPDTGFACRACGMPATQIVSGRELQVVGMEVPA